MKVLVIEDDPTVGNFVRRGLEEQRWGVQLVADGEEGERLATSDAYDVVILDMRLPGKSGMEVLNGLRARGFERPVLVLTAQDAVDAKVNALRAGADDYVTKPFGMGELLARIRAALRRDLSGTGADAPVVTTPDFVVDLASKRVVRNGDEVRLTPTEWGLVEALVRNAGKLVGQRQLLQQVWGPEYGSETNYLRVHMAHIRRKLEPDASRPRYFVTEPGMGYRFDAANEAAQDPD